MNSIGRKMIAGALCLLILLGCCSCASAQEKEYRAALALLEEGKYEEAYGALYLLGEYKDAQSYFEKFYVVPTETVEKNDKYRTTETKYTYNDAGQQTLSATKITVSSFTTTETTESITNTYDEHHNLTGTIYSENGKIKETKTYQYLYHTDDRLAQRVDVANKITENWEYHENGKIKKYELISTGGKDFYSYRKLQYDENGNEISENYTVAKGGNKYTVTKKYDDRNNMLQRRSVNGAGEETTNELNEYDANNNLIKKVYSQAASVSGSGVNYTELMTYDANNRLIKSVYQAKGHPDKITEYTYNEAGKLTSKVIDGALQESYEYDVDGNITKAVDQNGIQYTYTRTYDDAGHILTEKKEKLTDGFATDVYTIKYTYHENGEVCWIDVQGKTDEGGLEEGRYKYDERGNILSEEGYGLNNDYIYYPNGLLKSVNLKEYASYQYFYFPNGIPEYLRPEEE